jgi:hypothetical protein
MPCKLGHMLIIPKFKKGGENLSIGKHMHAKGQEIPILHLRPKVFQRCLPKEYLAFKKSTKY